MQSGKKRLLVLAAAIVFLCAQGALAEFEPAAVPVRAGVDVSQWQEEIDFARLKEAGVWGVYIRSTLGTDYRDPFFERNAEGARGAELEYGFYHFLTATSVEEAEAQAAFFAREIERYRFTLRPAMDFGVGEGVLSDDEFNRVAAAFLARVERLTGVRPVIYSDAYGARTRYFRSLTRYPLWVADYAETPEPNGKWDAWAGWQYADDGRVCGIDGNVDVDWFTDALRVDAPEPSPSPSPTPCGTE